MVRTSAVALIALIFSSARCGGGELVMHTITLSWDASTSADVAGYKLYYGEHSGVYNHIVDVGNHTNTDVANLIDGTTYYFVVTAYDSSGAESFPSEEIHYLPSPAVILNISARAMVLNGDNILIAGFIVGGNGAKKIVVRALGPSLLNFGIAAALADPILFVYRGDQIIDVNDDWRTGNPAELEALRLAPPNEQEAAVVLTLTPGNYSAVVRGNYDQGGVALVEVYDAGPADPQ